MENTYAIKSYNLSLFEERVAQVNKIAKKIGVAPLEVSIGDEYKVVRKIDGRRVNTYYFDVTVVGEYPQYNGWSFLTQLDHENNMVRSMGDHDHRHHLGDTTCDHCNTKRGRNVTYVIQNEDGNEMRVGGACLKYYIPTKSISSLAMYMDGVESFNDEESYGTGRSERTYSIERLVAWAIMYVRHKGAYHGGGVTKDFALNMANDYFISRENQIIKEQYLRDYNFETALEESKVMIDWAKDIEATNDFLHNVKSAANQSYAVYKTGGFVCAIVIAYMKEKEMEAAKKKEQEKAVVSEYVGTVKKRENFNVTLDNIITVESYYGDTYIHKFTDTNGNQLVWFGSKRLRDEDGEIIENGTQVQVKATVKKHEEYNGIKQTTVNRVALV